MLRPGTMMAGNVLDRNNGGGCDPRGPSLSLGEKKNTHVLLIKHIDFYIIFMPNVFAGCSLRLLLLIYTVIMSMA